MTVVNRSEDVAVVVAARLAQCTVAQGAETDLGARVFRGRRKLDDSQTPCCVLIEGADTPKDQTRMSAKVRQRQRYVLQAYVPCDADNPNDAAHAAIRDLKRAMFRNADGKAETTFDGRVFQVEYLGREMAPRVDGAPMVMAAIEIAVEFAEDLANP